ncbi:hypothetical protein PHYC_02876 [Phycisphaerales bacterium]|nr:hypothetical protein PHYC_02876 [Phycisphaerales bacterium]
MTNRTAQLLLACVLLGGAGCEGDPLTGPPEMRLGRDECFECGMLISEERCSSAAIIERDGHREAALFDDIGCELSAERQADGITVVERWVHDHDSKTWVRADQARFLYTDKVRTPMNSGIIAFADEARARNRAGELGVEIYDLETLFSAHARDMEALYGKPDP